MTEKIRILFLSANPLTTSRVRVDEEARQIQKKLARGSKAESFEPLIYPATRTADLQELLMTHKPHIVHFSGHGSKEQKIQLEDAEGQGMSVGTRGLVDAFRLQKDYTRVIVLNACMSEPQATALSKVIDYTIGIKGLVGDKAAVTFAGAFYLALGFGMPIEDAFVSARGELRLQRPPHSRGVKLFVRKGVDPTIRFPPNPEPMAGSASPLVASVQKLIDGEASADEVRSVRRATLDGSFVLEQADEIVAGEVTFLEPLATRRSKKKLRAQVNPLTYHHVQERLFPPPPGIGPPLPGLIVVGREKSLVEIRKLLSPLAASKGKEVEPNLLVVRGWPGVGKTTMVGVLGRNPEVLSTFPQGVLWTALERAPELLTKIADWGRALGTDEILRTPTVDEAVVKLAPMLRHRRMLLIVDDIWKPEHAFPFIKAAGGSSCTILATTRLPEVAQALTTDPNKIYLLPVLDEADSLTLLRYLAADVVKRYPKKCRQLVDDLGNLPLALHVAGRLLRTEHEIGLNVVKLIDGIREDARILEQVAPLDRAEGTVLPTVQALLKRSTDDLDDFTRDCFAYLGPFAPKPATFDVSAMKAVWRVADPIPTIRKLVGHGLLEPIGGRFQMHELLVKHARSLLQ
jgi:hypothetical protein